MTDKKQEIIPTIKGLVLGIALVLAATAVAWNGPLSTPPNNNTYTPINVSVTSQTKSGALWAGSFLTTGGGYFGGNVGVGNASPASSLEVGDVSSGAGVSIYSNGGYEAVSTNNSQSVVSIKGTGSANLLDVYDNSTNVFSVRDGGSVCVGGDCRTSWPSSSGFGAWENKSDSVVYYAATDGLVVARRHNLQYGSAVGYTDSGNPPTTVVAQESGYNGEDVGNITFPVRKGDYWKTTGCSYVRWIPLGS